MSERKQRVLLGMILLVGVWFGLSRALNNEILLPDPIHVFQTMMGPVGSILFYQSVIQTLIRIISGFLIALLAALLFALATYFYPWLGDLSYPLLLVTRSVPNISYILMVLFWCSAQTSVIVISFLILFPTTYATLYQGLCDVSDEYHDVMKLYPGSRLFDCRAIYLPFLRPYLHTAIKTGVSLSLKVGIMAEILGQVRVGIGRQLNICRLNLDMAGVFAWTLWIMLLLFLLERMIERLFQRTHSH